MSGILYGCNHAVEEKKTAEQNTKEASQDPSSNSYAELSFEEYFMKDTVATLFEWYDLKSSISKEFYDIKTHKKVMFSNNSDYRLVYDYSKKLNQIYNSSWELLGEMELESNNPEFAVSTRPLEREAGIFEHDYLKGFEIYKFKKGQEPEIIKVAYEQKNPSFKELVRGDNKLQYFYKENEDLKTHVYSLSNGKMLDQYTMANMVRKLSYKPDQNVYLVHLDKQTLVLNSPESERSSTIPYKLDEFQLYKSGHKMHGIFTKSDSIHFFSIEQGLYDEKVIPAGENMLATIKMVATANYTAILLFETNTPGLYSNETKLTNPQILKYEYTTQQLSRIPIPLDNVVELDLGISKGNMVLFNQENKYVFTSSE